MKKKINKEKENLTLSLFGSAPPVRVILDEMASKDETDEPDRKMDGGDTNCACE